MQMRREAVAQLARVCGQIDCDLLQLGRKLLRRRLVGKELAGQEALALPGAADDGPHEQVGHVDSYRLRQAWEA